MPPGRALPAAALAMLLAPALATAADVDHPIYLSWARCPLGTEVTIRTQLDQQGQQIRGSVRTKLVQKNDVRVEVEEVRSSDATGKMEEQAPSRFSIYRKFPLLPGVKPEDVGKPPGTSVAKGEETVEVGGTPYKCVWFDTKGRTEAGASLARTWMSDEVPGRLVKSRSEVPAQKRVLIQELVEIKIPE